MKYKIYALAFVISAVVTFTACTANVIGNKNGSISASPKEIAIYKKGERITINPQDPKYRKIIKASKKRAEKIEGKYDVEELTEYQVKELEKQNIDINSLSPDKREGAIVLGIADDMKKAMNDGLVLEFIYDEPQELQYSTADKKNILSDYNRVYFPIKKYGDNYIYIAVLINGNVESYVAPLGPLTEPDELIDIIEK